eukprot:g6097.t1
MEPGHQQLTSTQRRAQDVGAQPVATVQPIGGTRVNLPVAQCATSQAGPAGTSQLPTATPIYVAPNGQPIHMNMPPGATMNTGGIPVQAFAMGGPRVAGGGAPMMHPGQVRYVHPQAGAFHVVEVMELSPQERRLMPVFQLARLVRIFAVIDLIWVVLLALRAWPLMAAILGPLCGYQSTIKFEPNQARVYIFFNLLTIAFRIYQFTLPDVTNVAVLFGVCLIIIALYIIRLIATFIAAIEHLSEEDLHVLRNPNQLHRHASWNGAFGM